MRVALVGVVVGVRRTLCFDFRPHLLLQMKWQMTTIYDNDTAVGRAVVIVKAEGCKFETLHTHTHTPYDLLCGGKEGREEEGC